MSSCGSASKSVASTVGCAPATITNTENQLEHGQNAFYFVLYDRESINPLDEFV